MTTLEFTKVFVVRKLESLSFVMVKSDLSWCVKLLCHSARVSQIIARKWLSI